MSFYEAIILGVVEGVSEFLPISSTAHLIITSHFLGLEQTEFLSLFQVFIQSGAILAVFILYFKTVLENKQYIRSIIISFIPTAIVGFLLYEIIKSVFFNADMLIIAMLFLIGVLFMVIEHFVSNKTLKLEKSIAHMTPQHAIMVGLAQSLAVVPGVSRAGAVILGMMLLRYKRSEAALYSFLLAVPTIIAASLFDLANADISLQTADNIGFLALGSIVSFISALIFVKWLISYLQKNSLVLFGVYRIVLAILLFLFMR